ncbi:hypothetical protein GT715_01895 [Clostridium beijerinckii]|nr:hypothetical protein [Clostridium beijerinckii]MZK57000.1 hypothetical protein [Clostridium beijerinckii]MZK67211.1 hypothetical protein [Clostridium beijerinckii]MZK72838.1 hypothetical protein [Clostridium beijerinckii]MZK82434.1 hypothetical protein [Clostridium beijerinckii]
MYFINCNLIIYLSNGGEPSPDYGCGSPSYYLVYTRKFMINVVNIKIYIIFCKTNSSS